MRRRGLAVAAKAAPAITIICRSGNQGVALRRFARKIASPWVVAISDLRVEGDVMKKLAGIAALAAVWGSLFPSTASAMHTVDLTGTIVSQTHPGADPNISVGDQLHLQASFNDIAAPVWGSFGYRIAFLYGSPFSLTLNGLSWPFVNEVNDGFPLYTYNYDVTDAAGNLTERSFGFGAPAVIFQGRKVLGVAGLMVATDSNATPLLDLGSNTGEGEDDFFNDFAGAPIQHASFFTPAALSTTFQIRDAQGLYGNTYATPGFTGVWDLADSVVTDLPEPSTWAMMLLGLGSVGALARRRRAGRTA
jgi:hypothetical protein